MLTAKKSLWFEKLFAIYCRNLFRRKFHSLNISGLNIFEQKIDYLPTIIYCNHSSWWDGLVAFEISQVLKLNSFVMMEERQLKNLQLFRKLGAFSVVRENPRDAVKSLNYAVELLKTNEDSVLWIFPQGKILPNDSRPLTFFNGVSRIIEKTGECYAIPLAIRYEFLGEYKPHIFVKIGKSELLNFDKDFDSKSLSKCFEFNLTETLESLKIDIVHQLTKDYKIVK